ncbi:uncharacterized protein LOC111354695 [Spodoptera litura]|uniref:Uncharacterized protein LOC111354695 n=1 Tax=Spodoptera litura TaxID=69820 RepID=A0A9J7IUR3_SPOLT|nr:uncharacterized protein LOC111354695 [Spodoptera litura]
MSKNKEQVIAMRTQEAEEIRFKVGETVYKQVAKTARADKTKPVFKGSYKILYLHPNNVVKIIDIYEQIDLSLKIILDRFMLLEDAMTYAPLKKMHTSIISPQNLIEKLRNLENGDVKNLGLYVDKQSIKFKAYSTEHSVNFILEIPTVA